MNHLERKHIIDALATYICVVARRKNQFTRDIDTTELGQTLEANGSEQEKAHLRAREILRDFIR